MAEIRLRNLTKRFGSIVAVDDLTYEFPDGQVTCLLGPSGCGKTTLLRMIGGLETPTTGEVFLGDRNVTKLSPRKREIGMVFQYPVVYKGLTVRENIRLPLLSVKLGKSEMEKSVDEAIDVLDLRDIMNENVDGLDGVSRQKVSVAREVARKPAILLFDEPMTNVDANAKLKFKRSFKELTQRVNETIVYVTHDQTEAMTLADQIALMEEGKIAQYNDPRTLYGEPADTFGGWFLGNPGMNFFDLSVEHRDGQAVGQAPFLGAAVTISGAETVDAVTAGIRPERVLVSSEPLQAGVKATVVSRTISIGGQFLFVLETGEDGARIKAKLRGDVGRSLGNEVWVKLPLDQVALFGADRRRLASELVYEDGNIAQGSGSSAS
jgi:ABC-type sugar transport system ATPase subunit